MRWSKIKPSLTWTFVYSWLDAWDYSISHCFSPAPGLKIGPPPTQCFQMISKSHFLELGHQNCDKKHSVGGGPFFKTWNQLKRQCDLISLDRLLFKDIASVGSFNQFVFVYLWIAFVFMYVSRWQWYIARIICSQKADKQTREDIAKVIALCLSRLVKCGFSHVWGSLHIQHTSGNISLSFQGSRVPWES